jgi:APA family basic amino acid/polyamine antiporter
MTADGSAPRAELVRGLGLWGAIAVNVANMIGTGVFLKTRVMTCNVGSPVLVLAVWIAAGLLTLAGTFAYAEVAAMIPEAGGDYVFLRRAYGRLTGFLYGWTTFAIYKSGSQAALAVGFAIFLNVALGGLLEGDALEGVAFGVPLHLSWLAVAALAAVWVVAWINCRSVATGGRTAIVLTGAKVVLLAALAIGAFAFATGHFAHFSLPATGATCDGVAASARGGFAGFGAAMLGALWAYDGWSNVTPLAGEIRHPARDLPRAFVGGMLVVGALYLAVNLAYFYVLTPVEVGSVATTSSVATEVLRRFVGPAAVTVAAVALMLSAFGSLQASVLSGARIPFAMAREGLFFRSLGQVSHRTHVPARAVIAQAAWASVLAVSGSYDTLTDAAIFAVWLFYGLTAASLFVFRRTLPDAPRPYRALGYPLVPAAFIVVTLALLANTFVATPRLALAGVAIMLAGLPFYLYWSRQPPRVTPP